MTQPKINVVPRPVLKQLQPDSHNTLVRGLLGKALLTPNVVNVLYTVPDYVDYVNGSLYILNDSNIEAILTIYVGNSNPPSRVDLYESSALKIEANCLYIRDNIRLSSNEMVMIISSSANLIARMEGSENTII